MTTARAADADRTTPLLSVGLVAARATLRGQPLAIASVGTGGIEHVKQGAEYFRNLGATRVTECWRDDVPRGEVTDFFRATQAQDDETVVFSYIE